MTLGQEVILQQNLSDQCFHFIDGFSRPKIVLEKIIKYVQNRPEMSCLNRFLKILYNCCSQNGDIKC
jgi:hypothetical protein